jgi:hypothetical protein
MSTMRARPPGLHLAERCVGIPEVLERGRADDEIDVGVGKRQLGDTALPEFDRHPRFARVALGDGHEIPADIDADDGIAPELGQLDGEVAGARRDLEYARAIVDRRRRLFGVPPHLAHAVHPRILVVPARRGPFDSEVFETAHPTHHDDYSSHPEKRSPRQHQEQTERDQEQAEADRRAPAVPGERDLGVAPLVPCARPTRLIIFVGHWITP